MIIAVLFNSDDSKFDGYYGPPIRDIIFGTEILQSSNRHMKVKHGDVLIYSHSRNQKDYERIAEATYFGTNWSRVKAERIRTSYMQETIWAWIIQNVTHQIAEILTRRFHAKVPTWGYMPLTIHTRRILRFTETTCQSTAALLAKFVCFRTPWVMKTK